MHLNATPDEWPAGGGVRVALPSPAPGVDVWMCGLARAPDEVRALAATLSPAEAARAARFGRDDLRDRYVVGRATLRLLLGARLGCAAQAVEIGRGERGRPFAAGAGGLDFNVSHTAGVALIGFATDVRIGVDIEHGDRRVNVDGIARKFMAPDEQRVLAGLAPDGRRRALLRLWTCKEAMSKATGEALAAPFRRMSVATDGGLRLAAGPAPYVPAAWRLLAAAAPGAFVATVALWHRG
ncbi:MAG: 4'-phosphopantetheinyl transferase superfamily protein [Burkholderiales bacterium]